MESSFATTEECLAYLSSFDTGILTPPEVEFLRNYSHVECNLDTGYCIAHSYIAGSLVMAFYVSSEEFCATDVEDIHVILSAILTRVREEHASSSIPSSRWSDYDSSGGDVYDESSSSESSESSSSEEDESSSSEEITSTSSEDIDSSSSDGEFFRDHVMMTDMNSEGELTTSWRRRRPDEYPPETVVVVEFDLPNETQDVTEPSDEEIEVFIYPTNNFS